MAAMDIPAGSRLSVVSIDRPSTNRVLARLAESEQRRLVTLGARVHLAAGTALYDAGDIVRHAYFPVRGAISLLGMTPDGESLQVAVADSMTFAGIPVVLESDSAPHYAVAHVPCDAIRLDASILRDACRRDPAFLRAILQCAHAHVVHIGEAAVCHRFHTVTQRLSRTLLMYAGTLRENTVPLTQEVLASILGADRSAISRAAMQLHDCGATRQRHGAVQILSKGALRAHACECSPRIDTH